MASDSVVIRGTEGNGVHVGADGALRVNSYTNGEVVSSTNPLAVREWSFLCDLNSTSTPLSADAEFTGQWIDILQYSVLIVTAYSDVASATDGLSIEWSPDGITKLGEDVFTIPAGTDKTFTVQPVRRYFRIHYINGSNPQSIFNIQVQLKSDYVKPSSHRISDNITSDDDAELVKSVITGIDPDGTFRDVPVDRFGNFSTNIAAFGDTASIDPFARLRVSNPETLFDSKQLYDKQPTFWDEVVNGTASSVHVLNDALTKMSTLNSGDYVIRQSKFRPNYQPGKGQLAFQTFHMTSVSGIVERVGQFSSLSGDLMTAHNGIYLKNDGGNLSFNIAKNSTTSESVPQSAWNVDRLDGTGRTNKTLDIDGPQILVYDYEWLGVGRVRVGFVIDGIVEYVHYFNHANDPSFDSVYMSTPNNPLRYDIQQNGSLSGELKHICSTVISEGGQQETGAPLSVDNDGVAVTVPAGVNRAMLGIRLNPDKVGTSIILKSLNDLNIDKNEFKWSLQFNPVLTSPLSYTTIDNSSLQYAVGNGTIAVSTPGRQLASGYGSDSIPESIPLESSLKLGSNLDGTTDEIVLVIENLTVASQTHYSSIIVNELL